MQRAKNVLVSSLDSSLPKVSLEFFLNYESWRRSRSSGK